ncbi:hypothetical protein AWB77_04759 [Caballeronia fortuita]|uniref:Uncharacterized protein n=1 Tax=Caballeronia fortuita TaxID=1777138 RepID=A0A158D0N4_9BURK|nr:hypothetical protein [Caballeronia fortuita]SAK88214.1 hypothetical protein AWB77_04759 [Caballeronia fortuita]
MAKQRLYREELYDLVWAEEMLVLASRYQLSEEQLIGHCREMRIPFPTESYWKALRQGKKMKRTPLPDPKLGQVLSVETPLDAEPSAKKSLSERLRAVIDGAQPEQSGLTFKLPRAYRWHRLIKPIHDDLQRLAEQARQYKIERDRAAKVARHGTKNNHRPQLIFNPEHNGVLGNEKNPIVRASLGTYEYALFVVNEVCVRADAIGFVPKINRPRSRIELHRGETYVQIRVLEKRRAERIRTNSKILPYSRTLYATGKIELGIADQGSRETRFLLEPEIALDTQWRAIIDLIETCYARSVELKMEHDEWRKRYAEEEARRQEEIRRQQKLREEAVAESKRRDQLLEEAEIWNRVSILRRYLAELDARRDAGGEISPNHEQWREWAESVANHLDSKRVVQPNLNACSRSDSPQK